MCTGHPKDAAIPDLTGPSSPPGQRIGDWSRSASKSYGQGRRSHRRNGSDYLKGDRNRFQVSGMIARGGTSRHLLREKS